MSSERLIAKGALQSETPVAVMSRSSSSRQCGEPTLIFEELPKARIELVSRPETGDISPMLLSYTIDLQYKQLKWHLVKKASQVLYLHFALKKRAFIEELYEKREQVKEWLQSMGILDQTAVVQDDDEPDDGAILLHLQVSVKNRNVPSIAALPIIRPALGGQQSISDRGKVAMQSYLNHFLENMDIVNSREVWAVLKPGFLAFLNDPFDTKLLDIIVFGVLPASKGNGISQVHLGSHVKENNPLRYAFRVNCRNQSIKLRTTSSAKVGDWVTEINKAGLRPQEGWCQSHRFGSFAPQRGLVEDGSQAQWFIDGQAAFEAIASSIENAKSEIFITGWWICPEMFLKRPFDSLSSSRLDALLEEKAKLGVQVQTATLT